MAMGLWISMVLTDLLIPGIMIGFGKYFIKKAPAEINGLFGYRTPMSMKNMDTWRFAHHYCGRIWYACGLALLPVTLIPLLLVAGQGAERVGMVGGVICGVQMIPLVGAIFPTERALRKNFDKDGYRRQVPEG